MRPLRLTQLTDLHLFGAPSGRLLGLRTRLSFETVLAQALQGAGVPETSPRYLILTGDLVHDESPEGYTYLGQILAGTGLPYFCIPGNHDRLDLMVEHLPSGVVGPVAGRRLGRWHLIFLDTTIPGEDEGRLSEERLKETEDLIAADRSPTLIFLHHHPIPVDSAWMDTMGVENGPQLIQLCGRYPQVKALSCGHIHQELSVQRGNLQILGTPSTCVQFLPGSDLFAVDGRPPGYRELRLHPDGRLETWVERLADYPEPLDLQSGGY